MLLANRVIELVGLVIMKGLLSNKLIICADLSSAGSQIGWR